MDLIWQKVKASLANSIPPHAFRMWIEPLEIEDADAKVMQLRCPNLFFRKRVLDHFSDLIRSELKEVSGRAIDLDLVIGNGGEEKGMPVDPPQQLSLPNMAIQPHYGRLLREDYTFDRFVVGKSNEFAYSAALSLTVRKNLQQHSLFLLSKTGMGKSHLSQAIGHQILAESPAERVYYMTAEDFTNEMVTCG
jgi:chromosomal replication initiator protein